ncbi:deoxyuridine 5'-triphosphate nucleotidohydrolase [Halorussus halophilus]|uniref:deoxyuridine 5'-triphosphate nucleotidohydrolase n=1 Tax=Halorussus halophilus TaxID=2650975 RepID=UPI002279D1D1|nr:deoxyuridine 5'-triphosphate nucleotidohydrolase [Halorussus halophilus]
MAASGKNWAIWCVLAQQSNSNNAFTVHSNRLHMFQSGTFVAEHLGETSEEQVQPNGVDLTLEAVYEQREPGRIGRGGKEVGDRQELETEQVADDAPETYYLTPGGYVVQYAETVRIPEGHVGYIYPRSSLLRNSCMLNTAVWDAGYEGKGEGLLQVHHDIELEKGARIGQLVLAEADHDETYDGDYQGENVE